MPQPRLSTKHSVTINGHRTSITLEQVFWESFKEIAAAQSKSITTIIAELDANQPENLSSAIRIYILRFYKDKRA